MKSLRLHRESGAVSLFVVIFAMLIITVITVSFLRLMVAEQQQATDNDLSQSAYDSAQAGVEDAKRALLRYQQICTTSADSSECAKLNAQLSSTDCNEALQLSNVAAPESVTKSDGSTRPGEVKVQQSEGIDSALDQAYTCVTMQLQTLDYVGSLSPGESQLVPLVGNTDFNTVTVEWFSKDDVTNDGGDVTLLAAPSSNALIPQVKWNKNTPPVIRTQLIQFGSSFTMTGFDTVTSSGGVTQSNANSVFLYPTSSVSNNLVPFTALDSRKNDSGADPAPDTDLLTPRKVQCKPKVTASTDYSCSMSLTLPEPIGGGTARTAFLRLVPYYNTTSFRVVLSNGDPALATNVVRFKDVQPLIDSTGRANDIFRRIESRVNLYNTDFPYPDATIDVNGNFCKNFAISDVPETYNESNTCTP